MLHWMIKECIPNEVVLNWIISADENHRQRPGDVLSISTGKTVNFFINKLK